MKLSLNIVKKLQSMKYVFEKVAVFFSFFIKMKCNAVSYFKIMGVIKNMLSVIFKYTVVQMKVHRKS